MFLVGLKFALGLVAGLTLLSAAATLGMIVASTFDQWRKKRRQRLWKAKARVQHRIAPRFCERTIFQYSYRSDDWLLEHDKSERLP